MHNNYPRPPEKQPYNNSPPHPQPILYNNAYYGYTPEYNSPYYTAPIKSYSNKIGIALLSSYGFNLLFSVIFVALSFSLKNRFVKDMFDLTTFSGQSVSLVLYFVMFVPSILICLKLIKIPAHIAFPMRRVDSGTLLGSIGVGFGASIVGGIVVTILYAILVTLTGYGPVNPIDYTPRGNGATLLFIINLTVLAPIVEELLFRGVILQSLRRFGDGFALIVSSIVFGMAHGNLMQAPNAFVLGFALAYFTLYTGSMIPAIAIHFANNALATTGMLLNKYITSSQEESLAVAMFAFRVIIGIIGFVYLKSRNQSLFSIPPSNYPVKESTKYKSFFLTISIIIYALVILYFTISNLEYVGTGWFAQ